MRLNKVITIVGTLLSTTALATETPCDFKSKDKLIYEGSIESVRVVKKDVQKYVEDTRKCTMKMESRVDGKWYPSTGQYIFGPDMSEVDASGGAAIKAYYGAYTEWVAGRAAVGQACQRSWRWPQL